MQITSYNDFGGPKKIFTDLCSIAKMELNDFFHDDQQYVKDGIIFVDTSYDNEKWPRMNVEVAKALRAMAITGIYIRIIYLTFWIAPFPSVPISLDL